MRSCAVRLHSGQALDVTNVVWMHTYQGVGLLLPLARLQLGFAVPAPPIVLLISPVPAPPGGMLDEAASEPERYATVLWLPCCQTCCAISPVPTPPEIMRNILGGQHRPATGM